MKATAFFAVCLIITRHRGAQSRFLLPHVPDRVFPPVPEHVSNSTLDEDGEEYDPEISPGLFQGDMALTTEFYNFWRVGIRFDVFPEKLWKGGIVPYVISPLYEPSETVTIMKAIRTLSFMTCVRFIPWDGKRKDYLLIWPIKYPKGCWSFVEQWTRIEVELHKLRFLLKSLFIFSMLSCLYGTYCPFLLLVSEMHKLLQIRDLMDVVMFITSLTVACSLAGRFGGAQIVSLQPPDKRGPNCLGTEGRALHELMHALGVFHEQSRWDRDKFVKIHYENIIPQYKSNFDKESLENTTYSFEYDYDSIMHYGRHFFSKKKGKPTITPKQPGVKTIGQRDALSKGDCLKLNDLYGCLKNPKTRRKYYNICNFLGV